jgi:hypothetical protein
MTAALARGAWRDLGQQEGDVVGRLADARQERGKDLVGGPFQGGERSRM